MVSAAVPIGVALGEVIIWAGAAALGYLASSTFISGLNNQYGREESKNCPCA